MLNIRSSMTSIRAFLGCSALSLLRVHVRTCVSKPCYLLMTTVPATKTQGAEGWKRGSKFIRKKEPELSGNNTSTTRRDDARHIRKHPFSEACLCSKKLEARRPYTTKNSVFHEFRP